MLKRTPIHPGMILREYMGEGLTVTALASSLDIPRQNLSMLLNGRMSISASVALKLSEAFPNSDPRFWMNLQTNYDLSLAQKVKRAKVKPVHRFTAIKSYAIA